MDFSAFLSVPMRKHTKKPKFRQVEPEPIEEFVILTQPDEPEEDKKLRLLVKERSEMKFRTHEPKLRALDNLEEASLEDEWDGEKEAVRMRVSWRIVCGSLATIILFLLVVGLIKAPEKDEVVISKNEPTQAAESKKERLEPEARKTIEVIHGAVMRFHAASSVEAMLKEVRHPERIGPLMEQYYSKKPLQASEVSLVEGLNPLTIGTRSEFWVVLTRHHSGEQGIVVVEVSGPDRVKVDWETFVCYQPMVWDDFVKNRQANFREDFRVYVQHDDFYNYEFGDSERYQAYKLSALNGEEVLYGYVERKSPLYEAMEELLVRKSGQPAPMLLRLYLPGGLQSKSGVLIEKLIAPRWLVVDEKEVTE
jgi:hypothetical protein